MIIKHLWFCIFQTRSKLLQILRRQCWLPCVAERAAAGKLHTVSRTRWSSSSVAEKLASFTHHDKTFPQQLSTKISTKYKLNSNLKLSKRLLLPPGFTCICSLESDEIREFSIEETDEFLGLKTTRIHGGKSESFSQICPLQYLRERLNPNPRLSLG